MDHSWIIRYNTLCWLRRLRFTAALAKVHVTVVWIRAGGTSVGRLPCAFDLYTQLTRSRYNEKRTDPMVRPSNEIRGGARREKQYGRITFPTNKKRIYCHSLEYCQPITIPL